MEADLQIQLLQFKYPLEEQFFLSKKRGLSISLPGENLNSTRFDSLILPTQCAILILKKKTKRNKIEKIKLDSFSQNKNSKEISKWPDEKRIHQKLLIVPFQELHTVGQNHHM